MRSLEVFCQVALLFSNSTITCFLSSCKCGEFESSVWSRVRAYLHWDDQISSACPTPDCQTGNDLTSSFPFSSLLLLCLLMHLVWLCKQHPEVECQDITRFQPHVKHFETYLMSWIKCQCHERWTTSKINFKNVIWIWIFFWLEISYNSERSNSEQDIQIYII